MTLNEFQNFSEEVTEEYFNSVDHCAIVLAEEAGEVCGKVKKWGRDTDFAEDAKLFKDIKPELGDTLWCVSRMASQCGWTLEEVARCVLEKLGDRKKRNALHGEGDER